MICIACCSKITGNHSFFEYLYDMADGKMEGMFIMGQNPAVAAPNSRFQRKALAKLKWLVVRDMVEVEPASFWSNSPEIERGELKTEEINTEVFFFPAAGHAENDGTFTNTQRLLQFREKAIDPPGDCRSDDWFMHQLAVRLIAKAKESTDPIDQPLRALDWWYPADEQGAAKAAAAIQPKRLIRAPTKNEIAACGTRSNNRRTPLKRESQSLLQWHRKILRPHRNNSLKTSVTCPHGRRIFPG